MNLIPRNHGYDLDSLFNDFFHSMGRPASKSEQTAALAGMRVDVHETENEYEIKADLPGVKKADIEVSLENDILTVFAKKDTEEEKKKGGKVIWRERSSGSISRSFSVAPGTTDKNVKADFTDGVLSLTVSKPSPKTALPESKRINIK